MSCDRCLAESLHLFLKKRKKNLSGHFGTVTGYVWAKVQLINYSLIERIHGDINMNLSGNDTNKEALMIYWYMYNVGTLMCDNPLKSL
jgi:hypothetical protein